jgi:glucosamine-6-phosphate deaminase
MMQIYIESDKTALGKAAAALGGEAIGAAIRERGAATIVVATGASQFETIAALVRLDDIDWSRVTAFHLDEYIGMPETHAASFRRYLKERFTSQVPALGAFHFIEGDAPDLAGEIERINRLIEEHPIDVTFAGIGENAHLAFNDPPADFEAAAPFRVVELERRCRQQQFGEGWFPTLDDVPHEAISMTVAQIMKSGLVVLAVPDSRKAQAVRDTLEGPITPMVPASILRRHAACHLFLDPESAALVQQIPSTVGEQ